MLTRQLLAVYLTTRTTTRAFNPSSSAVRNVARLSSRAMSSNNVGLTDIGREGDNPGSDTTMLSWKARMDISIAKSRKIRGSNYVQISTVSPEGEPRCRTVVFRGFQKLPSDHPIAVECGDDNSSCVMKMITDNRSNKVSEASINSKVEMVWWFPKSNEQYRVRGKLMFVGGGDFSMDDDKVLASSRKEQWGNLSDPAREQFFWQEPGIDYSGESVVPAGGRDEEGTLLPPPKTYLLMFILPHHIDYLSLRDNYRQIDEVVEDEWTMKRVNP
jgi:pyridoxamine 5'-phosphate oxidase